MQGDQMSLKTSGVAPQITAGLGVPAHTKQIVYIRVRNFSISGVNFLPLNTPWAAFPYHYAAEIQWKAHGLEVACKFNVLMFNSRM